MCLYGLLSLQILSKVGRMIYLWVCLFCNSINQGSDLVAYSLQFLYAVACLSMSYLWTQWLIKKMTLSVGDNKLLQSWVRFAARTSLKQVVTQWSLQAIVWMTGFASWCQVCCVERLDMPCYCKHEKHTPLSGLHPFNGGRLEQNKNELLAHVLSVFQLFLNKN